MEADGDEPEEDFFFFFFFFFSFFSLFFFFFFFFFLANSGAEFSSQPVLTQRNKPGNNSEWINYQIQLDKSEIHGITSEVSEGGEVETVG